MKNRFLKFGILPNAVRRRRALAELKPIPTQNTLDLLDSEHLINHPHPQNARVDARVNLDRIAFSAIERAVNLKPNSAMTCGSNASTGVINCRLKQNFQSSHRRDIYSFSVTTTSTVGSC